MLLHRHLDVLPDGQGAEERAALEQHAPTSLQPPPGRLVQAGRILAEQRDLARRLPVEADDGAQQHRLAGAGAADHPDHLARHDLEVEVVMHDLPPELGPQAVHPDDRIHSRHAGAVSSRDRRTARRRTHRRR
jgi:hypothetical protein